MEAGIVKLNPQLMSMLAAGGNDLVPFKREIFVINVYVAGTTYCDKIDELMEYLDKDMQLTMRRHPENEVDEYAIGLYFKENRIGWVPMKDNLVMARLMDAGKMFTCKVVSVKKNSSWPRINVSIYMID